MSVEHPASEKQRGFMAKFGLPIPPSCTAEQATEAIGLAQIVLRYVSQIANQNWRIRVEDQELYPIVQAAMAAPGLAEQIRENMDASAQAAWTAVDDWENDAASSSGARRKIERRDVTIDVKEDACYFFVKMRLEKRIPELAARENQPPPQAQPPAAQSGFTPRIFLAQETRWERLKRAWAALTSRRAQ